MQLSILLTPLLLFLLVFIMFSISAFYHIIRFRLINMLTISVTAVFLSGAIFVGIVSASFISKIDWSQTISLTSFSPAQFNNEQNPEANNILTF